jgi:hypothetical protein
MQIKVYIEDWECDIDEPNPVVRKIKFEQEFEGDTFMECYNKVLNKATACGFNNSNMKVVEIYGDVCNEIPLSLINPPKQ